MLFTSAELIAQFQDYYVRHGIDISSVKEGRGWKDRQFAHWPLPVCLGGSDDEGVDLIKLHHVMVDLVVSEEVQHVSFFAGHGAELLERLPDELDAETCMFFQWLYEKWAGKTTTKSLYRNPDTEEREALTKEEAEARGWIHINAGQALYQDPNTGKVEMMTSDEAARRGWHSRNIGFGIYKNPLTGKNERWATQEAKKLGLVGMNAGRSYQGPGVTCPHCGHVGAPGSAMERFHFDNCVEKVGSWRWFALELKKLDPFWRQQPKGKWVRVSSRKGPIGREVGRIARRRLRRRERTQ